jgi:hypothetical protein
VAWMFTPLALVGFFDVLDASRLVIWTSSHGAESERQFRSLMVAAMAVAVVFFSAGFALAPAGAFRSGDLLLLGLTTLVVQIVFAACAFIALALSRAVASFFYRSAFWEAVFLVALGALVLVRALAVIVLRPLAIEGQAGWIASFVVAGCLALFLYGTALRHRAHGGTPEIASGVDLVVSGFGLAPGISRRALAAILCALAGAVFFVCVMLADVDWQLMLQQFCVIAAWIGFASIFYRLFPPREAASDGTIVWLEFCVLALGGLYLLDRWGARVPELAGAGETERGAVEWRSYDASLRLAGDAILLRQRRCEDEVYGDLRRQTGQAGRGVVTPAKFRMVDELAITGATHPDVFVIVVDGLPRERPDPATPPLTPEVDLLAREGTEFRNAFTRYATPAMSGPSIWFGGMSLHESYVEPFHTVNSLQKLMDAGRYRQFIGGDAAAGAIVRDGPLVTKVGVDERRDDACVQLDRMREALEPVAGGSDPVFAWVDGAVSGSGSDDAQNVRRVDTCIGGFIDFLRGKGIWDTSIVIVTGHRGRRVAPADSSALTPELLRVPLVVKLPRELQRQVKADPDAIAFNSDITPTLYYLLGRDPVRNSEFLGRPLFTRELGEQLPYIRGDYLVSGGNGPVYGVLAENGGRLYVADAINSRDVVHDRATGGELRARDPQPGERRHLRAMLDERLRNIADAYEVAP